MRNVLHLFNRDYVTDGGFSQSTKMFRAAVYLSRVPNPKDSGLVVWHYQYYYAPAGKFKIKNQILAIGYPQYLESWESV